jgi:hypothetical protein
VPSLYFCFLVKSLQNSIGCDNVNQKGASHTKYLLVGSPKSGVACAGWVLAGILLFASWRFLWADPVNWQGTASVASGGWGRMAALTNGNWLAVSTVFPAGTNSYLSILVSSNKCRNWSALSQIRVAGRTLDNGELVVLPNGNVLLTMRSLVGTTSFLLPVYISTDQGHTWSYLSNVDSSGGPGGLWEPHLRVLSNGTLVVYYSNETHPGYSQIISEKVSINSGTNWGPEIWAAYQTGGGSLRPGMPQSAQMADGRYILVMEVVNIGNADVYYKVSSDGITWADNLGVHIPCQHAGPFVVAVPDGQVFVTSCQNEVSFSRDFGATWQRMQSPPWVLGFNFSWPALYHSSSNELAAMVTWGGVNLRFGKFVPSAPLPNPLREDFDSGSDTNWTRYGGNFSLSHGAYLLNDTNTYGKALTGSEFMTDGVLEEDLTLSTPGNAGLVFRMTNPDYTGPDDGFGYYAGLDTSGFAILGSQSNSWRQLATAPMPVSTQTTYHLKVVMQGSLFKIFAADMNTPRITYTNSTWTRGQIGVRAFQCNASFDNFSFSNSVPMQLRIAATSGGLTLAWPLSPVNVKVFGAATLAPPLEGKPVSNSPILNNTQWMLSMPYPAAGEQYFWLQGQ